MISLAKPHFTTAEVVEVLKVLNSGWVAQGPRVKLFEQGFAKYCGAKYAVAVNSCTSGLHLALLAHGISRGDKVIVPDFTFVATGNVVLQVGAEVEIVDIDSTSLCMCIDGIEEKIDEDTKAIVPVHALGHPTDMTELNKLARKYSLHVIEDAASGLGSGIAGKRIGSFGNIASFSLQGRKIVTTGEGGMITSDSDVLVRVMRSLRSQGSPSFNMLGFSYRLSDIQAAVGLVQLGRAEEFIGRRIYLADYYRDSIYDAGLDAQVPTPRDGIRHTYQAYVILVEDDRDKIITKMREKGVETTIGTHSLTSMPLFKDRGNCPNGVYAFKHTLALPMYHELITEDIDYVVKCLGEVL